MKATVNAQIRYSYEVDIPSDEDDIVGFCDCEDPVYKDICKIFEKEHLYYDGIIYNIIDNETNKHLYSY